MGLIVLPIRPRAGKAAIVTGGSRGIGKAIARQLAREGVDVAVVARGEEALAATAKELARETGRKIVAIPADTTSDEQVKAMVAKAVETFGHIDILVNCAAQPGGQAPAASYADLTDSQFFDDLNTKVLGYLRCARAVAPHMKEQGWGRIISLSGMAARQASRSPVGTIRNAAVVSMTRGLADDLGSPGINLTVVHPGLTRTEATPGVLAKRAEAQSISLDEAERQMGQGNSIRRMVDASEIANVVTFLASPKSVAINGDTIAAAGGVPGAIYY